MISYPGSNQYFLCSLGLMCAGFIGLLCFSTAPSGYIAEAINADPSNRSNHEKLQSVLQVVIDDHQRLGLFEDVVRGLVEAGSREAAGLLATNLAEAMESDGQIADPEIQEALLRQSINVFPESPVAVRSLGYRLEQRGEELKAMELYRGVLRRNPDRLDLRLLLAASCSPFLDDAGQGDERFYRVSGEMGLLRHEVQTRKPPFRNIPSPGRNLAYMLSFSWQYMGRNMRPLMEALCWVLAAMTVGLHDVASPSLRPSTGWNSILTISEREGESREVQAEVGAAEQDRHGQVHITVGLVMERRDNHSPHRLIQGVIEGIDRSKFRVVVFTRDDVPSYPAAGKAVVVAADEILILPWHPFVKGLPEPFAERRVIAAAQVDVLLYMALGNTLGSHLLALGRLAPVQIVFGHGHPVTSGSPAIDYFVSSTLFETKRGIDAREARSIMGTSSDIGCAAEIAKSSGLYVPRTAAGDHKATKKVHDRCAKSFHIVHEREKRKSAAPWKARGDGTQDYTEQLIIFDSLTASLPEVFGPSYAPGAAERAARAAAAGVVQEGDHVYHCIQHSKKFHPDFDDVLRGVLLTDRAAKILLTASSKVHLRRWNHTLGPDLVPRLVFIPYISHSDMLVVVGSCHVMLDTFPWGAGVTSMEALSQGVPVVTLPDRISVLQLVAGQLAVLGVHEALVASDVNDMVKKATKLASNSSYRANVSATILARKGVLSNSRTVTEEWERFLIRAVRSSVYPITQRQGVIPSVVQAHSTDTPRAGR